jgi:hypothetical protein
VRIIRQVFIAVRGSYLLTSQAVGMVCGLPWPGSRLAHETHHELLPAILTVAQKRPAHPVRM